MSLAAAAAQVLWGAMGLLHRQLRLGLAARVLLHLLLEQQQRMLVVAVGLY